MEQIDTIILESNLGDRTNKTKPSSECDVTMLQFFKSKTNLFYHVKNEMYLYELSQWIITFNNYLVKKNGNLHTTKYKQGEEIIVDFGFAYGDELAYKHHCIVISQARSKVFVLPLTSNTAKAYDLKTKLIKDECAIAGIAEGFTKNDVVLLLNDARWISLNRIIDTTGHKIKNQYLYTIKDMLLQRTLGSIHNDRISLISKIKKLGLIIDNKNEEIKTLKEKILELESQVLETSTIDSNIHEVK